MTLSLKKAQEEADRVLGHMREAVVSVARMRFDAIIATGAMPGLVDEVAYLFNTGRYDMARNLLDLHEAYVEATVNFDIARQSAQYEHDLDLATDGEPAYLAEENDGPPIRILERDYERVVAGDPADLGTGMDALIVRLARLDPDEV
jgi:hypothetical protein